MSHAQERKGPGRRTARHTRHAIIPFTPPVRPSLNFRVIVIGVARFLYVAVPSNRSTTEGTALLLHRRASPDALGALLDVCRTALGTRLLLSTVVGAVLHLPPGAVFVQQVLHLALSARNFQYCRQVFKIVIFLLGEGGHAHQRASEAAALACRVHAQPLPPWRPSACSCPLLADPLSDARLSRAWDALDVTSLFVQPWSFTASAAPGELRPNRCAAGAARRPPVR